MERKIKNITICIIFLSFLSCSKKNESIKLATYTYSTNNRIDNLKPLSQSLERILNKPVKIISYQDIFSFIKGIKSNNVDIGLINTLGYLSLSIDNNIMEPIAALKVREDAVDNYKSVLLTTNDSIHSIKTLKDNASSFSIMFVNKGSTSGNLIPRLLLSSIGIESPENQFKKVEYGNDHTKTINKLLLGETDICALGSNEYYKQIAKDSTILKRTKVLWISDEIQLGPVLLNKKFSDKQKEQIASLFLNLHKTDNSVLESIKKGWSEAKQADQFHSITDYYYNNLREVNGNKTDLTIILDKLQK